MSRGIKSIGTGVQKVAIVLAALSGSYKLAMESMVEPGGQQHSAYAWSARRVTHSHS